MKGRGYLKKNNLEWILEVCPKCGTKIKEDLSNVKIEEDDYTKMMRKMEKSGMKMQGRLGVYYICKKCNEKVGHKTNVIV